MRKVKEGGFVLRKWFPDGKILTVPNCMSLFRLLLVPVIIWAYAGKHDTPLTVILLAVSALTDVLDGHIARHFNMISDLGKALDPIADKLTQVCVVLCLAFTYPLLWYLLGICVFRETSMGILGALTIRKTGKVFGARWYGKVSTVVLYATALALLLFPTMPSWVSTGLILLCMFFVTLALILYTCYFVSHWKQPEPKDNTQQ